MKKAFFALFIVGFSLFFAPAFAASSTADLSSSPAKREKNNIEVKSPGITGRFVKSDANLYYVARDKRSADAYREFGGCTDDGCEKMPRSVRAETKKVESARKYNLANPFFQPQEMKFASITDLSYTRQGLDFNILTGSGSWANHAGKYTPTVLSATEQLLFGATDDITILAVAQFAKNDLNIKWDTIADPAFNNDTSSESKLSLWGIGASWRVLDDRDWIANIMGTYQSMPDVANAFVAEAKVGYKNDDTTLYGFARAYYFSWLGAGEGYGFGFTNQWDQVEYFSQKESGKTSMYYEVGAGLFAALDADWSVDVQAIYGDFEWHSQISTKVTVSYQPWRNASVGLYGKIALWDSADGFESSVLFRQNMSDQFVRVGTAVFENYTDMSLGLQLIVSF